jgi:hypothetical protein
MFFKVLLHLKPVSIEFLCLRIEESQIIGSSGGKTQHGLQVKRKRRLMQVQARGRKKEADFCMHQGDLTN